MELFLLLCLNKVSHGLHFHHEEIKQQPVRHISCHICNIKNGKLDALLLFLLL